LRSEAGPRTIADVAFNGKLRESIRFRAFALTPTTFHQLVPEKGHRRRLPTRLIRAARHCCVGIA